METLKLAIKARLPFIHLKSDDLLYLRETLEWIAKEQVLPFKPAAEKMVISGAKVFYTGDEALAKPEVFRAFEEKQCSLIFCNVKASVLHFEIGQLVTPIDLIRYKLQEREYPHDDINAMLPAMGGLNVKESLEIAKLTQVGKEKLTAKAVSDTRQVCLTKRKGLTQVDTAQEFYQCPSYLSEYLTLNKPFFMKPVHADLTPRGLLFDGPPGTGKSAAAKYIANVFGLPLYRLDIGAMKGKYVGDSEGNLNAAIAQIDQCAPCVVLFDEVEKAFNQNPGGDGNTTTGMLSSLLWWLQEHRSRVFSIMTTNKKEVIPKELFRPGRIDETMLFLGVETWLEQCQFAKKVWDNLVDKIEANPEFPADQVKKRLESLGGTEGAVSQGAITQVIHDLLKTQLSKE